MKIFLTTGEEEETDTLDWKPVPVNPSMEYAVVMVAIVEGEDIFNILLRCCICGQVGHIEEMKQHQHAPC